MAMRPYDVGGMSGVRAGNSLNPGLLRSKDPARVQAFAGITRLAGLAGANSPWSEAAML